MGSNGTGRQEKSLVQTRQHGSFAEVCLFALNFIKHPSMVGGLLPSSPFLVDEVLGQVDWESARVIVEYGPGLGSFTSRILERMRPDARLVAFEINPDFVRYLKKRFKDPRFHLLQKSATEVDLGLQHLDCSHADYVISGIPFSALPHATRDCIVRKTHAVLRPRGSFLVYQVSGAVLPYLERVFGHVARDFEWLNIVPARMFYCAR
jgi:phospholipid N-methyltransferase